MLKKKNNLILLTSLALSFSLLGYLNANTSIVYADGEEPTTPEYYVCFKNQSYNVKNSNKMTLKEVDSDGDGTNDYHYYILENISLTSDNDFYISDQNENKFYASNGEGLAIDEESAYKYNIVFTGDSNTVFNSDYVSKHTELKDAYVSNSAISYEFYIPGYYTLHYGNDSEIKTLNLTYNPYQTNYDAYYVTNLQLNENDILYVSQSDDETNTQVGTNYVVGATGAYRIYFTPTSTTSGNDYCFDKDGNYGTGDDYKYNLYVSDYEQYYVKFDTELVEKDESKTSKDTYYTLTRDEKYPNVECYNSDDEFFAEIVSKKIKYHIYYNSPITNRENDKTKYKEVEDTNYDDSDDAYKYSKLTLNSVGWYEFSLVVSSDTYTFTSNYQSQDFQGYYMLGDFNNYGYNLATGKLNLDDKYKFTKIVENDENYASDYTSDYDQYVLEFTLQKTDLDEDEADFEFVISDGKTTYQNGTNKIALSIPGKYKILFSPSHSYATNNNYQFTIIQNYYDDNPNVVNIANAADFVQCINEWNLDSESSKFSVFNITSDIDFTDVDLPAISVFSGTINGNNKTLSNIHLTHDEETNSPSLFTLISQYGLIRDLNFDSLNIQAEDSSYVGLIGSNYGTVENVTASGEIVGNQYVGLIGYNGNYDLDSQDTSDSTVKYGYGILRNVTNNCVVNGKVNVGGLAGFNGGKIISCVNMGKVNVKSYSSSTNVINIGGITGYNTGAIVDTTNNANIGYKNIASHVGGIAGLSTGAMYYVTNNNEINGKYNVGGINGYFGSASDTNDTQQSTDYLDQIVSSYTGNNDDDLGYDEQRDITTHTMNYLLNKGTVNSTSYGGGIVGYNNATDLVIKEAISQSNVYANSGSYVGGLVGYMNGGSITSSFSDGFIESNGSSNQYVGGLVGYLNGTIKYAYSTCTISGTDYIGGLVGYGTSSASIISTYANTLVLGETNSNYVGNIAGFISGRDDNKGTYNDNLKYNYYIGYNEVDDNGGINKVNYGLTSKYAASRISYDQLMCKDDISANANLNKHFGNEENSDDNDILDYYFVASINSNMNPILKFFNECDVVEEDDFDGYDSYEDYSTYFGKYKDKYIAIQNEVASSSIKIAFEEWNEDSGDITEKDNYDIVVIVKVKYSEQNYPSELKYINATLDADSGKYYYQGDEAKYIVTYNTIDTTAFKNQVVITSYQEIITTLKSDNVLVEGEFTKDNALSITNEDNNYTLTITQGENVEEYSNLIVKIKIDNPSQYKVKVNDEEVTSSVYGEYIKFNISSSNDTISLIKKTSTLTTLQIVLISVGGGVILIAAATIFILISFKKHKETKKKN